jgi:hypothetical protein
LNGRDNKCGERKEKTKKVLRRGLEPGAGKMSVTTKPLN